MQDPLFPEPDAGAPVAGARSRDRGVEAAAAQADLLRLCAALPAVLRLGTSSWSYPGWVGTVWAQDYAEAKLSRQGLRAYAQHPLLRTVSLDRAFYRPLEAGQYAHYAAQVPEDFRFVVKAPGLVADALRRDESGRGQEANPLFLDADLAVRAFAQPALEGLRHKLGALVFQLSPVPDILLRDLPNLLRRLGAMLRALPELKAVAPSLVEEDDDQIIVRHLYIERRMTPLNIWLTDAEAAGDEAKLEHGVMEYGNSIKDLVAANIFPGDMLYKNFGVTRQGRVVFYDYDEIEYISDCNFRDIPAPRNEEDEMSAEPWYSVAKNDVFPEQFGVFLLGNPKVRKYFMKHHADLLTADYWRQRKLRIQDGQVEDVFPYPQEIRFINQANDPAVKAA